MVDPAAPRPLGDRATAPPPTSGLILQRGGEELLLTKVGDRFTVRLVNAAALDDLLTQLPDSNSLNYRVVPGSHLVEFETEPAQLEAQMAAARSRPAVQFASHVYALQANPDSRLYLDDELTVQFAPTVTPAQIDQVAAELGLARSPDHPVWDNIVIFNVTPAASANPIKLANQLMALPWVQLAEPNIVIQTQAWYRPREPLYSQQWYLQHQGGEDLQPNSHIDIEAAWELTRGEAAIVVAVIDDGFDLDHPDFHGFGKIVAPYDAREDDELPLPDAWGDHHGTAVAGVAIAAETGQGIIGVAPGCAFMPIRNTGTVDDRSVERMFTWAVDHGAAVICCSWGAAAAAFPLSLRQRRVLTQAATTGRQGKGCVVVFAAGNANRPLNGYIDEYGWPRDAVKGKQRWLNGYAIHPDVIAVAACTSLGTKAAYSNWGAEIAIAAPSDNAPPSTWLPGGEWTETGPLIPSWLPGRSILTSDRLGEAGYDPTAFTQNFGGTSSACPVVAGVAALMLSVNPDLTATAVRQLLQQTADKIIDLEPDPQLKLTKGTYNAQGHSDWFGAGKVNAARAVQAAADQRLPIQPGGKVLQRFNDQAIAIPDADPVGIRSAIAVTEVGQLRQLEVMVDVQHDFLGDLEIYLIPPQGEPILLQGRTLAGQTELQATYAIATTPNLATLVDTAITGQWLLWLVDHAPQDTGQLNRWQLNLTI